MPSSHVLKISKIESNTVSRIFHRGIVDNSILLEYDAVLSIPDVP